MKKKQLITFGVYFIDNKMNKDRNPIRRSILINIHKRNYREIGKIYYIKKKYQFLNLLVFMKRWFIEDKLF